MLTDCNRSGSPLLYMPVHAVGPPTGGMKADGCCSSSWCRGARVTLTLRLVTKLGLASSALPKFEPEPDPAAGCDPSCAVFIDCVMAKACGTGSLLCGCWGVDRCVTACCSCWVCVTMDSFSSSRASSTMLLVWLSMDDLRAGKRACMRACMQACMQAGSQQQAGRELWGCLNKGCNQRLEVGCALGRLSFPYTSTLHIKYSRCGAKTSPCSAFIPCLRQS